MYVVGQQCPHSFNHTLESPKKGNGFANSYSDIRPTCLQSSDVFVPIAAGNLTSTCETLSEHLEKEFEWLDQAEKMHTDETSSESSISWATYHASKLPEPDILPSINTMLKKPAHHSCCGIALRLYRKLCIMSTLGSFQF